LSHKDLTSLETYPKNSANPPSPSQQHPSRP